MSDLIKPGCGNCLAELKSKGESQCPFHDNPESWETNELPQLTAYQMAQYIIDRVKERHPEAPDFTPKQVYDFFTLPHGELFPLVYRYMDEYAQKHPRKAA